MKIADFPLIEEKLSETLRPYEVEAQTRLERTLLGPITPASILSTNVLRLKKLNDRKAAVIASWFLGDLGYLIREDLKENLDKWSLEEQLELRLLLHSRAACLEYILGHYSYRDFTGNLLNRVASVAKSLRCFWLKQPRAVRKQRHRGYRDHGSCRPLSRWLPSSDVSFTEEQLKIEEERDSFEDSENFILGLLGVI